MGRRATDGKRVWVYGTGDRTLFPLLADGIRRRQFFYWSHHAPMSMVYIDNLIDLLMLAAVHPGAEGEDFLAYDGEPITFEAVCERIASAIHSPPPSLYLPYNLVYFLSGMLEVLYRINSWRDDSIQIKIRTDHSGNPDSISSIYRT